MFLYRTIHNNFQSTRSLPWISLTEISLQDMMSVPNIFESYRIRLWAVEISQHQCSICQDANGQFCNIYAPLQQPSILYHSLIHQECSYNFHQMFTTYQENPKHQYTNNNCAKCVDTNYNTIYSNNLNNPHLPRRNHKIYYSKETHPCLVTTTSLQCYITTLSSTTMV